MDKIHDPAYWLKEIEAGRAAPRETGPTKNRPGRNDRVVARLAELNTERMLYKMRNAAGLTQAEVAERMGTSRPAATQLESRPISSMTVATLAKYADACGYRFDPSKGFEKIESECTDMATST